MNINGMEIERKYMIAMPDAAFLESLGYTEIVQTYLLGENGSTERVRKRALKVSMYILIPLNIK